MQEVIDSLTSKGRIPPAVVVVENEYDAKAYHNTLNTSPLYTYRNTGNMFKQLLNTTKYSTLDCSPTQ